MITLRPPENADEELIYEHQADPEFAAMAAFTSRDREAHRAHWRRIHADPEIVNRSVLVDGVLCGSLGSWLDDGRRLVGYGLGREFWGRGIASEALRQFVTDVVTERPLYAYVAATNAGSQRVLEKAGFVLADEQPATAHDGVEERLYILP
jgi:RimJ/RimL family protein N-acetyltransferase